ncbi:MAG TPA: BatA domain-containing protein [Gemmataceae bacterium]|nr:BatA domain-containing protein [Gemmataceae bacterium]
MFESFLNPAYLAAGTALISLPILIHLINRMRFKRVRWAAMEFLLKSQKRNRRRLLIEQLLLLALRCMLVLLAVLLVSRYLFSFTIFQPQNTLHVVVLDDSLSMSDQWKEDGEDKNSFKVGKDLIVKEIAKNAALARTAQRLILFTLSDPGTIRFNERLNEQSIQELQKTLAETQVSSLRLDALKGVEAAKELFDKVPQDRCILHVVSDFRQRDWSEPDALALSKKLEELATAKVKINLVDTAHPYRSDVQLIPLYHDNLAVTELRPETRIAARNTPVQFTVTVANFGASERKNVRVAVKVNGGERLEGSVAMTIPAGGSRSDAFQVSFDQLGFNQVSANLEQEEVGLQGDNTRYAVIEVRKQVPLLMIDGDPINGRKPGGDRFHLQTLFTAAHNYEVVPGGVEELEKPILDRYSSIYLLNIRELTRKARDNLEEYVRGGGSVAFFMGDLVRADQYNKDLYRDGKGIFPVLLADRPSGELEPDLFDGQLKLFVRNETHPIFSEVWQPKFRGVFQFLPIRRYYPVPRHRWQPEPGRVEELATLPNRQSIRDFTENAQEILSGLDALAQDPNCDKYRHGLENHRRAIQNTLVGDKPLYELANALDALLHDRGEPDNSLRPNLVEFWSQPEYQKLRLRVDRLREATQLGDPFVVSARFGKGRVVVFLTTAGRAWNDWAGGSPAMLTYPIVMLELQKYLTSAGDETELSVGSPLEFQLDSSRYDGRILRFFQPEARENAPGNAAGENANPIDLKEQLVAPTGGRLLFSFNEARKPGLYFFNLVPREQPGTPAGEPKPEQRAFVFNVDTRESDLRRAPREELERLASGIQVRSPGSSWADLANRQNDLSEWPWFYLIILVVLVAEQALAVHLSYHLKGSEPTSPARVTRPQVSPA